MHTLENCVIDKKYKLKKLLGEGGMGAVWLATHRGTGRPVALKLIVPRLMSNEEFLLRFQREARAAGRLRHPNIVDVTDFGFAETDQGQVAYLVMEYLQGAPLSAVLKEEKGLPLSWTLDIFEQVSLAVDYAHRHGVVHRDLKPDNIWLTTNDRGGFTIKVLDFGLARLESTADDDLATYTNDGLASLKTANPSHAGSESVAPAVALSASPQPVANDQTPAALSSPNAPVPAPRYTTAELRGSATVVDNPPAVSAAHAPPNNGTTPPPPAASPALTRVGEIMGTPWYMSPEQCRGEGVGIESDIYSLGVIAYEMMTGQLPFQGSMVQVINQHLDTAPPSVRQLNKRVPRQVAGVVLSSMAKSPDERPPNGEALASMLRAAHEGALQQTHCAFVTYCEFFPKLILASVLLGLPALLLEAGIFAVDDLLPAGRSARLDSILSHLRLAWSFFEFPLSLALMMRLVAQFTLSPLKPLRLPEAFTAARLVGFTHRYRHSIWAAFAN